MPAPTEKRQRRAASRSLAGSGSRKVGNLVTLAANAVRNLDLLRALELLEEIRTACSRGGAVLELVGERAAKRSA